jgi:hypothetical protein
MMILVDVLVVTVSDDDDRGDEGYSSRSDDNIAMLMLMSDCGEGWPW